jgi:hypothetical protein
MGDETRLEPDRYNVISDIYSSIIAGDNENYEASKVTAQEIFGEVEPARWLGFLANPEYSDSPNKRDLINDVMAASEETDIDPYILYSSTMQEGIAKRLKWIEYESTTSRDSFVDIGLDVLLEEMPRIMKSDVLDEPIKISPSRGSSKYQEWDNTVGQYLEDAPGPGEYDPGTDFVSPDSEYIYPKDYLYWQESESRRKIPTANITNRDAFRGMGALMQLNKRELVNYIGKEKWEEMPREAKDWWLYTSINAGIGNAKKYYDDRGVDMYKYYTGEGLEYPLKSPRTAGGAYILRELGIFE